MDVPAEDGARPPRKHLVARQAVERQLDTEGGATALARTEHEVAAVGEHDLFRDRQTEARSLRFGSGLSSIQRNSLAKPGVGFLARLLVLLSLVDIPTMGSCSYSLP
jgi:hypothetical protein